MALGADYDIAATPGFEAGGHDYYTLAGAERLRDALADFDGGRVLVSVLGQPFKCPPAPFEGSFLLHEYFRRRGIRDLVQMSTTFPMQSPVPVTGAVAQMFCDGLAERGVEELPQRLVTAIDPTTRTAQLASGETLPYDLFAGIPGYPAPEVLAASGLTVNGWVPVDQDNLRTQLSGVYALGDVCSGPRTVPKAGMFAESAALVVADDIAAAISGAEPPAPFDGSGVCYAEFGAGLVRARSRSTSSRARGPTHGDTTRRASTPSRRKSSARPGEHAGSVTDATPAQTARAGTADTERGEHMVERQYRDAKTSATVRHHHGHARTTGGAGKTCLPPTPSERFM